MALNAGTPHTHIHRLTRHLLEPAQDVLVLAIGLALFGLMGRTVIWLVREIFKPTLEFRQIIAEVLFILVMVEVVRLLIIYLEEHCRAARVLKLEAAKAKRATKRELIVIATRDLTNGRNSSVFTSDGVFGKHKFGSGVNRSKRSLHLNRCDLPLSAIHSPKHIAYLLQDGPFALEPVF